MLKRNRERDASRKSRRKRVMEGGREGEMRRKKRKGPFQAATVQTTQA